MRLLGFQVLTVVFPFTDTSRLSVHLLLISFLVAPTLGGLLSPLEHRAEFPQFLNQG
jgi:hypothetical protein